MQQQQCEHRGATKNQEIQKVFESVGIFALSAMLKKCFINIEMLKINVLISILCEWLH